MTFSKYCPHCKRAVEGGHGDPFQHLGSPIVTCKHCRKPYINNDMVEWDVSPIYRKISYFFSNNRKWLIIFSFLIPIVLQRKLTFIGLLPLFISVICCLFYVYSQVNTYRQDASTRLTKEYIFLLQSLDYPVKNSIKK